MPYTFKNLKDELRLRLWPSGEATNLVFAHDQMFIEAMVEIQRWVECWQINNTEVHPACNTAFKCGMTVIDKPRGQINRLYVIDQINQTTGLEDKDAPVDWCSEIEYRQVRYEDLGRYISSTLAKAAAPWFWGWFGGIFGAGLPFAFPFGGCGWWMNKWIYPPPDDADYLKAPALPLGFHYGQTSTDAPLGRARYGLYAFKGGQIFIAPWIQSTEQIILEWNGIKRSWSDLDLVDNDPTFKKTVLQYMRENCGDQYEMDPEMSGRGAVSFADCIQQLMYDCRKENQMSDEQTTEGASARGSTLNVTGFSSNAAQATAYCPQGKVGQAVTINLPPGATSSFISQADADAKAQSLALQMASSQLVCSDPVVTYYNVVKVGHANCSDFGAIGGSASFTVPAGQFSSTVSQQAADDAAQAAADQGARDALTGCQYGNDAIVNRHYPCPTGTTGAGVDISVSANLYLADTKENANALADRDAQNQATAALASCVGTSITACNDLLFGVYVAYCTRQHRNVRAQVNFAAGLVCAIAADEITAKRAANLQAQNEANGLARTRWALLCQTGQSD